MTLIDTNSKSQMNAIPYAFTSFISNLLPMKKQLQILACQLNLTVGAIEANAEKIKTIILNHQAQHQLIVFPELCLTGYPPEDLLLRPNLYERLESALQSIAQVIQDCYVVIGHPVQEINPITTETTKNTYFNVASIFHQGQCLHRYQKQQLPNYGVFDEQRYFTSGPAQPCLWTINGQRIGICICEDIWHEKPIAQLLNQHIDLLVCINASPYDNDKYQRRLACLTQQAQKGLAILYVNLVGGQDDLLFDGQSLAINPDGQVGARLPAFIETTTTLTFAEKTLQGPIAPLMENIESIYQALVLGTRDYVLKNGFSSVLLGLSGGIDSALTLAIAVDALGATNVHAVLMPSRHTAAMSNDDAKHQAATMGVAHTLLPIEPCFEAFLDTLAESFKGLPPNIAEENLQARIRGTLLMALSNKTGKMVLTTSNKSESAVGYTTLYGDMAGGFCVLKDVLKTQVYQLAEYRNSISLVIPERVIKRPPSAELSPNQTDQDSLPPYDILDSIIDCYVEKNWDKERIIEQGFSTEVVEKVIKLIRQNEYKRRQSPPGTRISPRALTRDWRYPITCGYENVKTILAKNT